MLAHIGTGLDKNAADLTSRGGSEDGGLMSLFGALAVVVLAFLSHLPHDRYDASDRERQIR